MSKLGGRGGEVIWTKSKSTAVFFSGNCLLHHNGLFSDQKLKLVQLCQGAFIGMVWTWRNQLSRVLKRIQFGFPQSDYPWHKGPSSTTIGEDEQDQMSSGHLSFSFFSPWGALGTRFFLTLQDRDHTIIRKLVVTLSSLQPSKFHCYINWSLPSLSPAPPRKTSYGPIHPPRFLAVQASSIGDLVTQWVSEWVMFWFQRLQRALQSCRRH